MYVREREREREKERERMPRKVTPSKVSKMEDGSNVPFHYLSMAGLRCQWPLLEFVGLSHQKFTERVISHFVFQW